MPESGTDYRLRNCRFPYMEIHDHRLKFLKLTEFNARESNLSSHFVGYLFMLARHALLHYWRYRVVMA